MLTIIQEFNITDATITTTVAVIFYLVMLRVTLKLKRRYRAKRRLEDNNHFIEFR